MPALVAHAKAHPGKINFASPGHGTPPHMVGEMLKQRAGIDIVHVPYKGTAAALTDIMGGQVEMTFENPSVTVPLVQGGKLKALAVTGETRNPQLPNVPTMIESGLVDFVSMSFTGVAVRAGTPPAIIKRLNAELRPASTAPRCATRWTSSASSRVPARRRISARSWSRKPSAGGQSPRHAGIRID